MDNAEILHVAHTIFARATKTAATATATSTASSSSANKPPVYKAIGISLAVASGLFIGVSFVIKKIGLLKANVKYNEEAGEGYGYLKNGWWWTGMTLMIIGEICNFVAYAFVDAILVTPLGALSVVITTILSAIFLKERLSFVGKIGCFICIIGSVVIVINAPSQASAGTIQEMQHYVIAPGFLSYAGVVILVCAFIAFWAGPRYGKKTMLVYLSICSLIGGLSVVATQGLGAAVLSQARGTPQFNQWFLYVLFVFVIVTLVTEIIFLNKALNLFNAALVTPTYYVFFTSSTIVASAILFRGFKGTPSSIVTVVMGFLQICSGVVLLQLSKSAKDVPDSAVFSGDLDQMRTVAEQEQPESEPKADAIRGTAAIIRRLSQSRQKWEVEEAKRVHEDRLRDLQPIGENEQIEWDGLRRRRTLTPRPGTGSLQRRKTLHPPLGLTHFPEDDPDDQERPSTRGTDESFMDNLKRRAHSAFISGPHRSISGRTASVRDTVGPVPLTEISVTGDKGEDFVSPPGVVHYSQAPNRASDEIHSLGMPPGLRRHSDITFDGTNTSYKPSTSPPPVRWADDIGKEPARSPAAPATSSSGHLAPQPPPHKAKRQFSFQDVFHRSKSPEPEVARRPSSRLAFGSRHTSREYSAAQVKNATEEERLGLVKGDSQTIESSGGPSPEYTSDPSDDEWQIESAPREPSPIGGEKELAYYQADLHGWSPPGESHRRDSRPLTRASEEDDSETDRRIMKEWEFRDVHEPHDDDRGGEGGPSGAFI
ncbi:MAG: hypothetical protein M1819_001039 [Sarea resinae]|nr:MAG: hypothetical protein M1819_001039 [Sarea resinae]